MRTMCQTLNPSPTIRRLIVISALALALLFALGGCIGEDDLSLEQRAYQLERQLMCPVCDGQTVEQSNAQISEDMKALIRQKLADGDTNQQIKDYFVDRYGEIVLAAPGGGGFSLIAWIVPVLITVSGLAILVIVARNLRHGRTGSASQDPDPELAKYLKMVDADLGLESSEADGASGRRPGGGS